MLSDLIMILQDVHVDIVYDGIILKKIRGLENSNNLTT